MSTIVRNLNTPLVYDRYNPNGMCRKCGQRFSNNPNFRDNAFVKYAVGLETITTGVEGPLLIVECGRCSYKFYSQTMDAKAHDAS